MKEVTLIKTVMGWEAYYRIYFKISTKPNKEVEILQLRRGHNSTNRKRSEDPSFYLDALSREYDSHEVKKGAKSFPIVVLRDAIVACFDFQSIDLFKRFL